MKLSRFVSDSQKYTNVNFEVAVQLYLCVAGGKGCMDNCMTKLRCATSRLVVCSGFNELDIVISAEVVLELFWLSRF